MTRIIKRKPESGIAFSEEEKKALAEKQRRKEEKIARWKALSWKQGQSGNPAGRPRKEICIPDILRDIGTRPVTEWMLVSLRKKYGPMHDPKNMREAMLMAAYADAARGEAVSRAFIADRTEGKVPQAQINLNQNQDTDDLTKLPLRELLEMVQEASNSAQ